MGLKTDIENAFVEALGIDVDDKGDYPELAQNLTDAIIKFIQAQKFTITDMTAVLEAFPRVSIDHIQKVFPFRQMEDQGRFLDALRKAGLPES